MPSRCCKLMSFPWLLIVQLFTQLPGISFVAHPGALGASARLAAAFREFGLRVGIRCARVLVARRRGAS